jgi:hypothetical protein
MSIFDYDLQQGHSRLTAVIMDPMIIHESWKPHSIRSIKNHTTIAQESRQTGEPIQQHPFHARYSLKGTVSLETNHRGPIPPQRGSSA